MKRTISLILILLAINFVRFGTTRKDRAWATRRSEYQMYLITYLLAERPSLALISRINSQVIRMFQKDDAAKSTSYIIDLE